MFDRSAVFVGSMNLDQRSVRLNTEMGLIIESELLASAIATRFNALTALENAYRSFCGRPTRWCGQTREHGSAVELRRWNLRWPLATL